MNHFYFISNDNITRACICQDGVHLNRDGTRIVAGNVIDLINAKQN